MSLVFSDFWGSFAHTGVPTSQNTENWIKYQNLDEVIERSINYHNLLFSYYNFHDLF